jgi:outer membrane protein assembly factor BamA
MFWQMKSDKAIMRVLICAFILLPLLTGVCRSDTLSQAILEPVEDTKLNVLLQQHFSLPLFLNAATASDIHQDRAIKAEASKLKTLMHTQGYLGARIEIVRPQSSDEPLRMRPVPGPLYRLGWVRVDDLPPEPNEKLINSLNDLLDRYVGKRANRQVLAALRSEIRWTFREASFANAEVSQPQMTLEPETRTAGVVLDVVAGAPIRIGRVKFQGAANRRLEIAKNLVPVKPGDLYKASVIDTVQEDLDRTGLFRRVRISLSERPNTSDQYDLNIEVRDGPSDPVQLKESGGLGPFLVFATILLIVFRECVRATKYWKNLVFRSSLTLVVFLMTATSGMFIVQRIAAFLS